MQREEEGKEAQKMKSKKVWRTSFDWIPLFVAFLGILFASVYIIVSPVEKEKPDIERVSEQKTARISLIDTYQKQGVKYYVFKTDISGAIEFVLSEEEYDKYIGIGNDAVDCTVYKIFYKSLIFRKIDLLIKDEYTLENFLEKMKMLKGIEAEKNPFDDKEISITRTNGKCFNYDEYNIFIENSRGLNSCHWIYSELSISKYSFMGEVDFTPKEVEEYQKTINWTDVHIKRLCEYFL